MDINVSTIIFPLRAKLSQQGYWMKHSDVTTCVAVHRKGDCEKDMGKHRDKYQDNKGNRIWKVGW